MKAKHGSATQILRHIVQIAAFFLFPELFITVLHALGDVVMALVQGNFSVYSLWSQLITLAVVLLVTAVWGRFFCGFLCSFGALQELLYHLLPGKFHHKMNPPVWLDQVLSYLKYLVLAFIVAGLWIMALPMDASLSPWGVFGMLISGNPSVMAAAVPTAGFLLLLGLAVGSLFWERFFCRYFCPLGALFTLISGKRAYKIRRHTTQCTRCGLCEKTCSMGVPILKKGTVSSGECINCMRCVDVCPRQCLSASPAPAIAGTAAAVTMCGLVQIGTLTVPDPVASTQETYSFSATDRGNYVDGVYTGVGTGFRGDTEVQVTVENGYITDITVLSYEDDLEFFQKAQSSLLDRILSEQSVNVQNVSGATFSGNGILEAVANALGVEPQATAQPEEETTPVQDSQSSATTEENPDAVQEFSALADGTYQGEGEGFRGTTSVSVTVKGGQITDISILSYEDDDAFFSRAEGTILDEILENQSLDVACVSGATFSSNGILEAVANALNVDFDNPNQANTGSQKGGHGNHGGGRRGH